MDVHSEFVQAMQTFRLCVLTDTKDRTRLVEPYGIFLTRQNKPMYCCYQIGGYSGSGNIPNWRNFPVSEIKEAIVSRRGFRKREDFNPDNDEVYHQWIERIY